MHCCDPLVAYFAVFRVITSSTFERWCLWRPCTFSVTYQLWNLHCMQITTPASVFIDELRSNTGLWARSIVGSDRPALDERISEFSSYPGSLAVQKIKCHVDDSPLPTQKLFRHLWNTLNSPGWFMNARTSLKKGLWKPFCYLTVYVHNFQPNTFSVLYKTARIVNKITVSRGGGSSPNGPPRYPSGDLTYNTWTVAFPNVKYWKAACKKQEDEHWLDLRSGK